MSSGGGVELDRTVESIRVGVRFRHDLGDLDELCDSIAKLGLLQPITITPDGILVCGARRLAAVKRLGWERVKVWIDSTVSTRLHQVLAERDENAVRKPLAPTEAAALYDELRTLYAADAARRQQSTRFGRDGAGKFPAPSPLDLMGTGRAREHAARAITGRDSSRSLERVVELQRLAAEPTAPDDLREVARRELAGMDADGKINPHYLTVQAAVSTSTLARLVDDPELPETVRVRAADELDELDHDRPPAELVKAAQAAIARATNPSADDDGADGLRLVTVKRYGPRAFVATMDEMDGWWQYYDPAEIAAGLSDEQWQRLCACLDGSTAFVRAIGEARCDCPPGDPSADRPPHAACF